MPNIEITRETWELAMQSIHNLNEEYEKLCKRITEIEKQLILLGYKLDKVLKNNERKNKWVWHVIGSVISGLIVGIVVGIVLYYAIGG